MAGSIWEALKTSSWQESGTRNLREVVIRYGDKTLGYSLGETSDRQPMIEGEKYRITISAASVKMTFFL